MVPKEFLKRTYLFGKDFSAWCQETSEGNFKLSNTKSVCLKRQYCVEKSKGKHHIISQTEYQCFNNSNVSDCRVPETMV